MKKLILFSVFIVFCIEAKSQNTGQYNNLMHSDSTFGVGDSLKLKGWPSFKRVEYLFAKDYSQKSVYRGISGDTTAYLINVDFTKLKDWMTDLHGTIIMFDDGTWIDGKDVHLKGKPDDPGSLASVNH
jgi:hypothetical protein